MPAAAKARTSAGAEAFVRYYMDLTNEMKMHPRPGIIAPLSTADCKSCKGLEEVTLDLIKTGQHHAGPPLTLELISGMSGRPEVDSSYRVLAQLRQGGFPIVDKSGRVTKDVPTSQHSVVVHLIWQNDHWLTDKVKVLGARK